MTVPTLQTQGSGLQQTLDATDLGALFSSSAPTRQAHRRPQRAQLPGHALAAHAHMPRAVRGGDCYNSAAAAERTLRHDGEDRTPAQLFVKKTSIKKKLGGPLGYP
jgi:hypothetical protein